MRTQRYGLKFALTAVVCAALAAGCGDGDDPGPSTPDASAHGALCEAQDAAQDGDVGEARRVFQARAHEQMHDLAARVEAEDRSAAARLLEAKAAVESSLTNGEAEGGGKAASALSDLAAATVAAIEAVGGDPPTTCQ